MMVSGKSTEIAKGGVGSKKSANKSSQEVASGTVVPAGGTSASAPPSGASGLPVIPGVSGSAIQQMGGVVPVPPSAPVTPPLGTGSKLPPIPGVSGKAQGNGTPPSGPAAGSEPPRAQVPPQNTPQFMDYARRLGVPQISPDSPSSILERMKIVNAGTYRVDVPPPIDFSDDVKDMLRRQELAKKNQGKEKEQPTSTFLQSGTVVNGPR